MDAALARHITPDAVAPADAPFETFLLPAPLFRRDEIEKRVAGDVDEAMCREQLFDLLARPAAGKSEPIADRTRAVCSGGTKYVWVPFVSQAANSTIFGRIPASTTGGSVFGPGAMYPVAFIRAR